MLNCDLFGNLAKLAWPRYQITSVLNAYKENKFARTDTDTLYVRFCVARPRFHCYVYVCEQTINKNYAKLLLSWKIVGK